MVKYFSAHGTFIYFHKGNPMSRYKGDIVYNGSRRDLRDLPFASLAFPSPRSKAPQPATQQQITPENKTMTKKIG